MDVYYSDAYVASEYAFDTTRKSAKIAESLTRDPIPGVTLVEPTMDEFDELGLALAHAPRYINAVKTGSPRGLAESNEFNWDKGIYPMALAHTQGLLQATRDAWLGNTRAGSLSSGQHHASRFNGKGYGTFNGVAIAALEVAKDARVLILDFDAHRGGGTWDIVAGHPNITHIDVSVNTFDDFVPRDKSRNFMNLPWYIHSIEDALDYASGLDWDILIYNAGMDPINFGVTADELETRESLVADFVGDKPMSFAMAGGYEDSYATATEIVNLHRLTIAAMAQTV